MSSAKYNVALFTRDGSGNNNCEASVMEEKQRGSGR